MCRRFRVLAANVGDVERQVDEPHPEFERRLMRRTRRERREDGGRHAAVPPSDHFAAFVDPRLDALRRNGVQEVMVDVVLAGPLQPHRRADRARNQRRFQHVIALRLSAETTAEQRHVDRDIPLRDAERFRQVLARAARALHRRPDLRLAVGDVRERDRRLHAHMREVRQVVLADHHLVGALQRAFNVAVVAHHQAGLARR